MLNDILDDLKDGKIIDDTRIKNSLKTIQYAIDKNVIVRYLRRRGAYEKFLKFISEEVNFVSKELKL